MALARLVELVLSRRNLQRHGQAVEGRWTRATYPLIVLLHSAVFVRTLLRGSARPHRPWLWILLAVQPLRAWVLVLLGDRWNARAAVPSEMAVETRGPYGLIRHPNYAVVVVELLALPMAFRLSRFAFIVAAINAVLLAIRVREEEAALSRLPRYQEHFGEKARFIPGVF